MLLWHSSSSLCFWILYHQINSTENRSVLHVALRAPRGSVINSDGKNVVPDVWQVLDKIKDFSDRVRSDAWVILITKYVVTFVGWIIDLFTYLENFKGWSHWEAINKCYCNWDWRKLSRPSFCSYSTSNRLSWCKDISPCLFGFFSPDEKSSVSNDVYVDFIKYS